MKPTNLLSEGIPFRSDCFFVLCHGSMMLIIFFLVPLFCRSLPTTGILDHGRLTRGLFVKIFLQVRRTLTIRFRHSNTANTCTLSNRSNLIHVRLFALETFSKSVNGVNCQPHFGRDTIFNQLFHEGDCFILSQIQL